MLSFFKRILGGSNWRRTIADALEDLLEDEAIEALEKECGETAKTADVVHAIARYVRRKLGV